MIEFLGHKFKVIEKMPPDYFKCIMCEIIVLKCNDELKYIISDFNKNFRDFNKNLISCNEIVIKNLLE